MRGSRCVKTCTELVMWVWLNAVSKLKSYLQIWLRRYVREMSRDSPNPKPWSSRQAMTAPDTLG